MPVPLLTPRRLEILRFIHQYRTNNGCSPTMQEVGRNLGISKVTVFEHVEALVQKNVLLREPNKARSLMLNPHIDLNALCIKSTNLDDSNQDYPADADQDPSLLDQPGCYPLAGTIAAGIPIEAIEQPEVLELPTLFETPAGTYALQVRGDSMIDDHICDGDYVLVSRNTTVRDGQIVVAILEDGEATLKRFYRQGNTIRLQPANADYEPIYVQNVDLQGVVIGVVRRV